MHEYKRSDKGSIDTKVGDTFEIEGGSVLPIIGKLSFSPSAFNLLEWKDNIPKAFGGRPTTTYTFEALLPGTYEIEYQRFDPRHEANTVTTTRYNLTKVDNAEVYRVTVVPRE